MRLLATLLLSLTAMNASFAQSIHTPAPGSPERKALLDAARAPLEARLRQPVLFTVDQLGVAGDWAFLLAHMQGRDGQPVDFAGTSFEQAAKEGGMSRIYAALLQRRQGQWTVEAEAIGPTDVAWTNWAHDYGAPAALFGH
jgi:hypothetical protein